jgi:hypothetical protein
VLKCPLYNLIRGRFPSLLENVVLRNFKSFVQLEHQNDISLYLTEITCHIPQSKNKYTPETIVNVLLKLSLNKYNELL